MLKACVYTDSSKNAPNRQKMAKIGTLSLVPRVFRIFRRSVFKEVEKGK